MEAIILLTLASLLHVTGWLLLARAFYAHWRLSKVPLCSKSGAKHVPKCYQQVNGASSDRFALTAALTAGFCWPVLIPACLIAAGVEAAITTRMPELPAERAARLKKDLRTIEEETHDN